MSGGVSATTIATIASMAVTAVSTGVSIYAQSEQQKAQARAANNQAEYNAQVAENERAQQEALAQNEVQKGVSERERVIRQAQRQQGEATSALASQGFDVNSGSNLSMLGESAEEAQYDANIVTQNANNAAWQHLAGATGAQNDYAMAQYQKANADSGKGASMLAMGGTLLGGIGQGLGQYKDYLKTQPGNNDSKKTQAGEFDHIANIKNTIALANSYKK